MQDKQMKGKKVKGGSTQSTAPQNQTVEDRLKKLESSFRDLRSELDNLETHVHGKFFMLEEKIRSLSNVASGGKKAPRQVKSKTASKK